MLEEKEAIDGASDNDYHYSGEVRCVLCKLFIVRREQKRGHPSA